jgi:hypothetical protein
MRPGEVSAEDGDEVRICNKSSVISSIFSPSKYNRFGNPTGVRVGKGACVSVTVHNPTADPLRVVIASEIQSFARVLVNVAPAGCEQWDVTGTWTTIQSNRYRVTWKFTQSGTTITGTGVLPAADASAGGYTGTVGQLVKGKITGDRLDVVVQWPKRTDGSVIRGEYVGTVKKGGAENRGTVDDGQAWDVTNPGSRATWTGSGAAKCTGK